MMHLLIVGLTILTTLNLVSATPYNDLVSNVTTRQTSVPPVTLCDTTCNHSDVLMEQCGYDDPTCNCHTEIWQAMVDCKECHFHVDSSYTPQRMAEDVIVMEYDATVCHDNGYSVTFAFQLPPDTQALVDELHRQDARLRQRQTTFLALQVTGGHVGLVIAIAYAVFSPKAHRDPTFFNFCLTWIISSIFYSLLLYGGITGNMVVVTFKNISRSTCEAQAALVTGAQAMTACSTMALVIQLWMGLRVAIYGDSFYGSRYRKWTTIMFLVFPYVLFFSFAIPSVIFWGTEFDFGSFVLATGFYCTIDPFFSFVRVNYAVTLALLTVAAVFDVLIILLLYRHWNAFRRTRTKNPVSLSVFVRVILFSLYRIIVAMTYGTVLNTPPTIRGTDLFNNEDNLIVVPLFVPIWVDMLQAAIPLVAFLVLGLNDHMIRTFMFWRKKTDNGSETSNSG